MVSTSDVGSTTIISFQTKFPTFSDSDLDSTMTELGYQRNPTKPTSAGQSSGYFYTKDNTTVDVDFKRFVLNFRFFNSLNIKKVYDDVQKTLLTLKIDPKSIALMGLDCKTMAHDIGMPSKQLTSLISNDAKTRIAKTLGFDPAVYSLVFVSKEPVDEDLQIRIEPLVSNPTESFFIHVNYKTKSHDKFDSFIGKFGEDTIKEIADSMSDGNETND